MITIKQLKALNKPENIAITEHARIRLYERHINIEDIVNGINTGETIYTGNFYCKLQRRCMKRIKSI